MTAFGTRGTPTFQKARTVACPTCGASRGRPCERLEDSPGYSEAVSEKGFSVSTHAARKRLEKEARA